MHITFTYISLVFTTYISFLFIYLFIFYNLRVDYSLKLDVNNYLNDFNVPIGYYIFCTKY